MCVFIKNNLQQGSSVVLGRNTRDSSYKRCNVAVKKNFETFFTVRTGKRLNRLTGEAGHVPSLGSFQE